MSGRFLMVTVGSFYERDGAAVGSDASESNASTAAFSTSSYSCN